MGEAKRKRDHAAMLEALAAQVDLAPLTDPEVRAAVLAHMLKTGLVVVKLPPRGGR